MRAARCRSSEVPPLPRRQVLLIEEKIASGATIEDAETLAAYARLAHGTNGFNEFRLARQESAPHARDRRTTKKLNRDARDETASNVG